MQAKLLGKKVPKGTSYVELASKSQTIVKVNDNGELSGKYNLLVFLHFSN